MNGNDMKPTNELDRILLPTSQAGAFDRRHILLVSDDFLPAMTGVGSHLQTISQELQQRGHRVVVLTSRRQGQMAREMWNGVHVCRVFSLKIAGFYQAMATASQVKSVLEDFEIDLVHHHYLSGMLYQVFKVAKKMNIPQVYTYHMSDSLLSQPFFMRPFRKLIHWLALKMYNQFDVLISPSKAIAKELKEQGVHTPVQVISNPVSFKSTVGGPEIKRGKSEFQILFAGRMAVEKNIPLLMRAFVQVRRHQPAARLRLAGEGPMKVELMQLARDLRIEDDVDFLGHLNATELSREYTMCDAFVLPSVKEVQAIVVLEAMRFGKPVIVTDQIASAKELVSENENGFIVNAEKEEDLTEKLLILNASPGMKEKMGRRSLEKSKAFEPEHILVSLQQVYQFLSEE